MKILNKYTANGASPSGLGVWAYFYKKDDTSYVTEMSKHAIQPNETLTWYEDYFNDVKVGIKDGNQIGWIVGPGQSFAMDELLRITPAGELDASVSLTTGQVDVVQTKEVEFVDLTQTELDVEREVTFAVEKAYSTWKAKQVGQARTEGWSIGATFGGTIKDPSGQFEGKSEYKAAFERRVTETLAKSHGEEVKAAWQRTSKQRVVFGKGKLHAVSTVWQLQVQHAQSRYFYEDAVDVEIVIGSKSSDMQVISVDSPDDLPGELREQYNERFGNLRDLEPG